MPTTVLRPPPATPRSRLIALLGQLRSKLTSDALGRNLLNRVF